MLQFKAGSAGNFSGDQIFTTLVTKNSLHPARGYAPFEELTLQSMSSLREGKSVMTVKRSETGVRHTVGLFEGAESCTARVNHH